MPSFMNILKKIGSLVVGVEHVVAPIAEQLLPQYSGVIITLDKLFTNFQTAVVTVEANAPVGTDGKIKESAVIADFEASLEVASNVAEASGQVLVYDKAELKLALADQVSAYNRMSKVKASIKMVPKPPAPAKN